MTARFELDRLQRVDASASTALLRVAGAWRADPEQPVEGIALELDGRRFEPLPDPLAGTVVATPGGSTWRAAFHSTGDES